MTTDKLNQANILAGKIKVFEEELENLTSEGGLKLDFQDDVKKAYIRGYKTPDAEILGIELDVSSTSKEGLERIVKAIVIHLKTELDTLRKEFDNL